MADFIPHMGIMDTIIGIRTGILVGTGDFLGEDLLTMAMVMVGIIFIALGIIQEAGMVILDITDTITIIPTMLIITHTILDIEMKEHILEVQDQI